MSEIKLKPCPFCGCELSDFPKCMIVKREYTNEFVNWKHSKGDFVGNNDYRLYCQRCGARGRSAITEEKAIEAWNNRIDDIIRCRDCKYLEERHYEEIGEEAYIKYDCKYHNYQARLDGYCHSAKRRTN